MAERPGPSAHTIATSGSAIRKLVSRGLVRTACERACNSQYPAHRTVLPREGESDAEPINARQGRELILHQEYDDTDVAQEDAEERSRREPLAKHRRGENGQRDRPGVVEGLTDLRRQSLIGFEQDDVVQGVVEHPQARGLGQLTTIKLPTAGERRRSDKDGGRNRRADEKQLQKYKTARSKFDGRDRRPEKHGQQCCSKGLSVLGS